MSEKFVHVIKEDDGTRDFPKHKIQYHGKPVDAIGWYGYGVFGNPDDCMARLERVGGNEQRVVWPDDPTNRPAQAKNDSGIFNPTTGAKVHFKANGDLEVTTTGNLVMNGALFEGNFGGEEVIAILAEMIQSMHDLEVTHSGDRPTTAAFKALMVALKARVEGMGT
ncbi:hypothetical protein LCGC14_1165590 [marine sediment metagenome]|uniref:Uncharacterized protein n=1 Tax=marine sediment metagenome TaxID=412755 RepID=A0A0F9MEC7_9ZZZZ